MIDHDRVRQQLEHALHETDLPLPNRRTGKVRDIYELEDHLVLVTTDRVSAFDHVLGTVPFKGEILNRIAARCFEETRDVLPNHVVALPDPNVVVARKCRPYPVEFVIRGHVAGSLWRDHASGRAGVYEVDLPEGLQEHQELPQPVCTPTTKARLGAHDEPTSRRALLESGILSADEFDAARAAALALFQRGRDLAQARGLILVDTKYELGVDAEGTLTVIDEIHTPDSSRYWVADGHEDRIASGEGPRMLDKENLREWLRVEKGFEGAGEPPPLDDDIRLLLSQRYMEVHRLLLGAEFQPVVGPVAPRIEANLRSAGWISSPAPDR